MDSPLLGSFDVDTMIIKRALPSLPEEEDEQKWRQLNITSTSIKSHTRKNVFRCNWSRIVVLKSTIWHVKIRIMREPISPHHAPNTIDWSALSKSEREGRSVGKLKKSFAQEE